MCEGTHRLEEHPNPTQRSNILIGRLNLKKRYYLESAAALCYPQLLLLLFLRLFGWSLSHYSFSHFIRSNYIQNPNRPQPPPPAASEVAATHQCCLTSTLSWLWRPRWRFCSRQQMQIWPPSEPHCSLSAPPSAAEPSSGTPPGTAPATGPVSNASATTSSSSTSPASLSPAKSLSEYSAISHSCAP